MPVPARPCRRRRCRRRRSSRHPPPDELRQQPHPDEHRPAASTAPTRCGGPWPAPAPSPPRPAPACWTTAPASCPRSSARSTNPGRTSSSSHARPVQRVGEAAAEPVQPGLGRAVDVVGTAHPHPGDRREHDDRSATRPPAWCRPARSAGSPGRRSRCARSPPRAPGSFSARAWSPSMPNASTAVPIGPCSADDRIRPAGRATRGRRRRIRARAPRRPRLPAGPRPVTEIVGATGRQHHGRAGGQPLRQLDPDLAAAAENHDRLARVSRVFHGCDYLLRYVGCRWRRQRPGSPTTRWRFSPNGTWRC